MKLLAAALTLLAPLAARAEGPARPAGSTVDGFQERVAEVSRVAADPDSSVGQVWEAGKKLEMNDVRVAVDLRLRGWDMGGRALGDGRRVEVAEMIAHGRQKVSDLGLAVPEPLRDAVAEVSALHAGGRVAEGTQADMGASQMGRIRYKETDRSGGDIDIHELMPFICGVIGKSFCYATVAHEARHLRELRRGNLSDEHVILNELLAFKSQYDWVVRIDPQGERLSYARAWVNNLIAKWGHNPVMDGAQRYLTHLAELRQAGDLDESAGSDRNLRAMIERYGYAEGAHGGHAHPTRS